MLGYLFGYQAGLFNQSVRPVAPPPLSSPIGAGQFAMLQSRVDSLELACAALWKLLKDKNNFTDDELKALIQQIDAADGAVDGRITPQAGVCPHCHHNILSRTAGKCLWCGAPLSGGPFGVQSAPPG